MTTEEMIRLFEEELLSTAEIGKRIGISRQAVQQRFDKVSYRPDYKAHRILRNQGKIEELAKKDQWLSRYVDDEESVGKIAKDSETTTTTVSNWLRGLGVEIRKGEDYVRKVDPKEAIRLYKDEQWTMAQIAEKMGVAPISVLNAITRRGVETPCRAALSSKKSDQIVNLYLRTNWNLSEIAKQVGVDPNTVSRVLARRKVRIKS